MTVHTDGRTYTVPAGTQVRLTPGESIHIQQYLYHDFAVEERSGPVLLGEVSQCNDDNVDNRFELPVGRFRHLEVLAIAANHIENARKKAEKYGLRACTVEELLADGKIDWWWS